MDNNIDRSGRENWTAEQFEAAQRMCERQGVDFNVKDFVWCGDYIGRPNTNGMFIGIEKDGYTHT